MSLPVITIRPQPGCAATVAAGLAARLKVEGHPLFAVEARDWDAPLVAEIDGLLIGSANAVRHGGPTLGAFSGKPAHVVGEATAAAARDAGLAVVTVGSGGLQKVLDRVAPGQVLLRLAGEEHVALAPPAGVRLVTRIAYASRPLPMDDALAARLRGGALVLLHSAEAARHFAAECDRLGVPRSGVLLAALGPRIAAAAGEGWAMLASAEAPREGALLALAREMCQ